MLALARYYRAVWARAWELMGADLRASIQVTIAFVILALVTPIFVEVVVRLGLLEAKLTRELEFGQAVHDGAVITVAAFFVYALVLLVSSLARAPASLYSELVQKVSGLETTLATKVDPVPLALSDEVQQFLQNEVAAQVQSAVSQFPATAQAITGGATTDPPPQGEQGAKPVDPVKPEAEQ